MKVAVIIPCYNEADYIGNVVSVARNYVDNVLVVDNGSYDDNVLVARKNYAEVVYSHKRGMGAAIEKGFKSVDSDIYVTMDGDGQHNPNEIPSLLSPLLHNQADLVVGVRKDKDSMPDYRKFGNNVLRMAYNINSPIKLIDVQCGFRAFNKKVSQIPLDSSGFGCVFELLVKARKYHYRIAAVEVSCIYHDKLNGNSTLNPLKHGLIVISNAVRWRLWELKT